MSTKPWPRISELLHRAQQAAARSPLAVRAAVRLRNQCNMVIKYRFAMSPSFAETGEGWLTDAVAPTATTIIDVGANVGDWTARVLSYGTQGKRFVAIEPGRATYQSLASRFAGVPEVTTRQAAVSNEEGQATFYEYAENSEHSSLAAEVLRGRGTPNTVTLTTLDKLISDLGWPAVDFLKIDTEGYDLFVMQGAKEAIAQQRIGVLQFEYNEQWRFAGSTLAAASRLLREAGYTLRMLRHDGLYEFDYATYGDYFGFSNFVAISPQALPMLQSRFKGAI